MRELTPLEQAFFREAVKSGNAKLSPQHFEAALAVDVHPEDLDYHHIQLVYPQGTIVGRLWTPVAEWAASDVDGASIEILAFADEHGRLHELEIHRTDCKRIIRLPSVALARRIALGAEPTPGNTP